MSTQLRRFAQAPAHSPARAKFFLVVADISGGPGGVTVDAGDAVVSLATGVDFRSAMSAADFETTFTSAATVFQIPANTLLKDLGREVIVYSNASPSNHLYKYRQVQIVSGPGSEGVFDSVSTTAPNPWQSNVFVLVWAAAGAPLAGGGGTINVVRTG
jgi:hypothetical protein